MSCYIVIRVIMETHHGIDINKNTELKVKDDMRQRKI